ncbi:DUF2057 domain-containing protein [Shewanella corallii]|uniref:DUF2057 domain-containing protein n=1 Tax=Shewanella corallii TaxID=560080 RepID=A0ABT0NBF4_9GAMM|nr:DUF2057 domain-containing protein [Shewanella corallii]MCL2915803.1 DUF2057 domain-containing protein [Shewanella corallii]
MKSLLPVTALLALFGPASALAGNLSIPMSFEYLAMDGQTIESSLFNHKADLHLPAGEHKIAIRYHELVEDDFSDSQSFIKSAPFIVTMVATEDGEYKLKPAGSDVVKYPEKFAKAPKIELIADDGGKVAYSVEYTDLEESNFISRLLGDNSGVNVTQAAAAATATAAVATQQPVAQVAAMPQTVTQQQVVNPTQAPQSAPAANPNSAAHAEQMLQYWWLQADEQTRKQFMSWAIKQL